MPVDTARTETAVSGRRFLKMHGLRNHFVIVDAREEPFRPIAAEIVRICDSQVGVGADQLVVIEASADEAADAFMRLYNVDGREAEACGNATRCVAWLLMDERGSDRIAIRTLAGVLECRRVGELLVRCDMGPLRDGWQDIPLSREVDTGRVDVGIASLGEGVATSLGNPHIVFFVNDLSRVDLPAVAPAIQQDALFPRSVNVGVCRVRGPGALDLAVFERGAGLTMACGSGACAAVHAARRLELVDRDEVAVALPGGTLTIRIDDDRATMTGPVAYAFEGIF